jgi:hypothetical protein
MSHTDRLRRSPNAFRQLTGITPVAFDRLLAQLAPAYEAAEARRKDRPDRKRKPGAGPKRKLPLSDRLLMLLIYYRTYVSHAFLAFLFGVDDSTVCRNFRALEPLLAGIFRIPERKVEMQPGEIREVFFDGTERPKNRPKKRQRRYYSGKKKRHTLKNQIVVVRKRKRAGRRKKAEQKQKRRLRIAAVSPTAPGKVHDKKIYDETRAVVPAGVKAYGDTGYQGTALRTPVKKKPKQELTRRQRRGNRRISRKRIAAEHGIGKMKVWRIASERFRNPTRRHTLIIKNVAGLHNLMFA